MNTETAEADFDPDAVAAALFGTWSFPDTEEPTGTGLLHFTDTGRAIQFVFNPQQPKQRFPMRLWYSIETPTHLRFRPKPEHEGWLQNYSFAGSTFTLSAEDRSWVCTQPSPDEIPEWFHQVLASALART